MINQTAILLQTVMYILSLKPELKVTDNSTTSIKPLVPRPWFDLEPRQAEETFKCHEPYGCFSIESPWPENRPVNLFPEPPAKINPGFCLYTWASMEKCQPLLVNDTRTFFKSNLRGDQPTFFIVHGYLESGNKTWIKTMSRELLKNTKTANVIAVDWRGGSGPPYAQAVANIRLVGRALAMLITKLKEEVGVQPENCHIIGHSLGSHTGGYAGHALSKWGYRLGRITGMDPAEPHFVDTDPEVRLDPSDALYVDVIHTDAAPFISGGFGLRQPVGHVDFYPNGGEAQPGCDNTVFDSISHEKGSLLLGIRRALGCNHVRSYEFFTESINTPCDFLAVECESWEKFESGACFSCPSSHYYGVNPACSSLGFRSRAVPPREHVTMYLKTAATSPFCRHHYLVELVISNSSRSVSHGGEVGEFWLELHGDTGHTERIRLQDGASYFEPGSRRRRVVAGGMVGHLEAASVEWDFKSSMWNPLTWRLLTTPQIFLESLTVEVLETGERLNLCTGSESLLSGSPRTFTHPRHSCKPKNPPKH